jgi:predicted ATPase with chaperone activity
VPLRQAGEAKLVAGIDVFGIASITQLIAFLRDEPMPLVDPIEVIGDPAGKHAKRRLDLADVAGQVEAKWACEVAAAGRHHMLFQSPPGVGKTCSRSVFRVYFPISTCMTPSRCLRCTRWLASTLPTSSLPDRPTATPTIQPRSPASSAAASG